MVERVRGHFKILTFDFGKTIKQRRTRLRTKHKEKKKATEGLEKSKTKQGPKETPFGVRR